MAWTVQGFLERVSTVKNFIFIHLLVDISIIFFLESISKHCCVCYLRKYIRRKSKFPSIWTDFLSSECVVLEFVNISESVMLPLFLDCQRSRVCGNYFYCSVYQSYSTYSYGGVISWSCWNCTQREIGTHLTAEMYLNLLLRRGEEFRAVFSHPSADSDESKFTSDPSECFPFNSATGQTNTNNQTERMYRHLKSPKLCMVWILMQQNTRII